MERFQQTLKKWLRAQARATTIADLQAQLDAFTAYYNTRRPHRSLPHRATPATAYAARPKAAPGDRDTDTHHRVRADRIDTTGKVTLRHHGRLYHIGLGRAHARTSILLLAQDLHIRIINAATGELLRKLPRPRPQLPAHRQTQRRTQTQKTPNPVRVRGHSYVLRHHTAEGVGFEPTRTRQRPSGFQGR